MSPLGERAENASKRLAAKLSWNVEDVSICAWICLSWCIEVHLSASRDKCGCV